MNFFLHQLDIRMEGLTIGLPETEEKEKERGIELTRYGNDRQRKLQSLRRLYFVVLMKAKP